MHFFFPNNERIHFSIYLLCYISFEPLFECSRSNFSSTKTKTFRDDFFAASVFVCFSIPRKMFKNSGVANFFCASSLLSRISSNAFEIHWTASECFASGMMKEKASTTGSELRSLLDEGL